MQSNDHNVMIPLLLRSSPDFPVFFSPCRLKVGGLSYSGIPSPNDNAASRFES